MEVTDIDGQDPASNQIVDTFSINIDETTPIGIYTTPTWYNGSFEYASIKLSFKVECLVSYYLKCDTSCIPSCVCLPGYEGRFCETEIDECLQANCPENSRCSDGIASYSCECFPGFVGEDCIDERTLTTSTDIITSTEEPHGGGGGGGGLICAPGFTGASCDVNIDECTDAVETCNGRGDCVDGINNFTCSCHLGFTGRNCEISMDKCAGITCTSGNGECVNSIGGYSCRCLPGYTGTHCETSTTLNPCLGIACSGNGKCENGQTGIIRCACDADYTGPLCETKIDDCLAGNCSDTQDCEDGVNTYSCICKMGYTGDLCGQLGKPHFLDHL